MNHRDRGSADALGLALLAPAAIGLAVVIVFLGRGVDSRATVQGAAEAAAQAAARERSPVAAVAAAQQVGAAMLVDRSSCSSPQVFVDTSAFGPGGQVAVTVSCTVSSDGLESGNSLVATALPKATGGQFRRGDADGSGKMDLTDAVFLLAHLFLGGAAPGCPASADSDGSGRLDLTDAVAILDFLFLGGRSPPEPFAACGVEAGPGGLDCPAFEPCR